MDSLLCCYVCSYWNAHFTLGKSLNVTLQYIKGCIPSASPSNIRVEFCDISCQEAGGGSSLRMSWRSTALIEAYNMTCLCRTEQAHNNKWDQPTNRPTYLFLVPLLWNAACYGAELVRISWVHVIPLSPIWGSTPSTPLESFTSNKQLYNNRKGGDRGE